MKKICGLITAAVLVTATAVTSFAATDNVTADINKVPHTALNDENKYKYDAGNIWLNRDEYGIYDMYATDNGIYRKSCRMRRKICLKGRQRKI